MTLSLTACIPVNAINLSKPTLPNSTGWAENCTSTVSPTVCQQIVLQCVPIKLVLLDLSDTRSIAQTQYF